MQHVLKYDEREQGQMIYKWPFEKWSLSFPRILSGNIFNTTLIKRQMPRSNMKIIRPYLAWYLTYYLLYLIADIIVIRD